MKKNKSLIWIFLASFILGGGLVSCNDEFFETPNGGRIDPSLHYNTYFDAVLSYLGCFVYLQDIAENQIIVDGLRSDQMMITENSDIDMIDLNLHNLSADNKYIDPSNYYKLIININEVLPNLPQILELDRDFDEFTLKSYEGTLITLRSWAYFMLAKTNGEVGILPEDLSQLDLAQAPEYISKNEIIHQLIDTLVNYNDPKDISRFDIDHYILLGELYLEIGDYENAVKYLKFAADGPYIEGEAYKVSGTYSKESWEDIFINSQFQSNEVYVAVPYSFVDGQKNMLDEWTGVDYSYMVKPSNVVVDSFMTQLQLNGKEGDVYRGEGITFDFSGQGEPYITKYSRDKGIPHSADVILYRAADTHLLLAEALNRLGEHESAMALLNRGFSQMGDSRPAEFYLWSSNRGVRGRASLKAMEIPPSDTAAPMLYIESLIMEERSLELAFEGKRWFDLVRIAERRDDNSFLADRVAAKFDDPIIAEEVRQKLMIRSNWYLPIPKED